MPSGIQGWPVADGFLQPSDLADVAIAVDSRFEARNRSGGGIVSANLTVLANKET